jgi:hypothetical protein
MKPQRNSLLEIPFSRAGVATALAAAAALAAWCANAATEPASASGQTEAASAANAAPVKLSYNVADVLKLAQAKVSDNVILAYVKSSGTTYGLNAEQIVYLRSQGVSDGVLAAMLDQNKKYADLTAQTSPQLSPAATAPVNIGPTTTYVPSSSLYVIPSPTVNYGYADYYDYYSYGYGAPFVFSYGWPYYYGGGVYRGGAYRGGFYRGGGGFRPAPGRPFGGGGFRSTGFGPAPGRPFGGSGGGRISVGSRAGSSPVGRGGMRR